MRSLLAATLLALVLGQASCNDVPISGLRGFSVEVSQVSEPEGKIQLDILWIIDNSTSMCQEQWTLARAFVEFADMLTMYLESVSVRLAVVTTNILQKGEFQHVPAESFPPACVEEKPWPCLGDADCKKKFGAGWGCEDSDIDASDMYNMNGSLNTFCKFQCNGNGDCCEEFCFEDECAGKESCLKDKCKVAPNDDCTFVCRGTSDDSANGCQHEPDVKGCGSSLPKVLSEKDLDKFRCIATTKIVQSYAANKEEGLKLAWWALNPTGPNTVQADSFLRPDAYLVIVFVSDEDDCSIDEAFAAPNAQCTSDKECTKEIPFTKCKTDVRLSQVNGREIKVCTGQVKKDYYNVCSLLGEYKGPTHHSCAFDMECSDCSTDDDCDYGWYCKKVGSKKNSDGEKVSITKCRPKNFSFSTIASYQQPPGTPIFALAPVSDYYSKLRSLKSDPAKVLVAAITGDGVIVADDKKSLISKDCLEDERLLFCQEYAQAKKDDKSGCDKDPAKEGCEVFHQMKLDCARDCYFSSKGDQKHKESKNTYICESPYGKADFGSRYVELAQMFGPNGLVSNICSQEGIAPALEDLAELIIKRVTKICLPLPVKDGEKIVVTKTVPSGDNPTPVSLSEGLPGEGDYTVEMTQDCCDPNPDSPEHECRGTQKAITFNEVVEPTATIEVKYEAETKL